jgi:hypothetical protein
MYALRLPVASGWWQPILTTLVPVGIALLFLHVAWHRRLPGRLAYFPFFTATLGMLGGLALLDLTSHLYGLAIPGALGPFDTNQLLDMGVKTLASTFVGGVLVGGVLAGRAVELSSLSRTRMRSPRLRLWTPPRITRGHTSREVPPVLRSVARATDTLAYVLAVAFRSMSMSTCNACIHVTNRAFQRTFAGVNAMCTLVRRFARRLSTVVVETVLLLQDGFKLTRTTTATFLRFYLLPLAALVIFGRGILGIQDGVGGYVGIGNAGSLAIAMISMLLVVGAVSALAGLQTFTSLPAALQIVLRALVEPAVGALLFFILLSLGLALSSTVVGTNPYRVGPVTIGAALLVVGGFSLQLMWGRNDSVRATAHESGEAAPLKGTAVQVAPALWLSAALGVFLLALTVCSGGAFA